MRAGRPVSNTSVATFRPPRGVRCEVGGVSLGHDPERDDRDDLAWVVSAHGCHIGAQ